MENKFMMPPKYEVEQVRDEVRKVRSKLDALVEKYPDCGELDSAASEVQDAIEALDEYIDN